MTLLAHQACKHFSHAKIKKITELGKGLINDTYLVNTDKEEFILQQINSQVFPRPELIMKNLLLLNQHISKKIISRSTKLKIPRVLNTINQKSYFIDKKTNYWRALEFIKNTKSKESISDINEGIQVGSALGHFHHLLSDLSIDSFQDTLPGFHITSNYYQHYQRVEKLYDEPENTEKSQFCRNFIAQFKDKINVLEIARQKGLLTDRITHGDPKLNNFLFDKSSDLIVSLIDLDTVKPGLVQYDIADCLRSCCHISQSNTFDLEICRAILQSYLQQVGGFFTNQDYEFLYPAIQLIPFELGLRFFTDYLEGDYYFKVDFPEQNIDRAIAQFYLCKSIEEQEEEIKRVIASFKFIVKN